MSVGRISAGDVGAEALGAGRRSLIGIDMAPESRPLRRSTRFAAPALALMIGAALGLAVLRMDVVRIGYTLTETHREEQRLREELRGLTVSMRQLRAPSMLSGQARELGFVRPQHVIELGGQLPASSATHPAPPSSPAANGRQTSDREPAS